MTGIPYTIPLALNDTLHVLCADVNLILLTQEVAASQSHSCSFVQSLGMLGKGMLRKGFEVE